MADLVHVGSKTRCRPVTGELLEAGPTVDLTLSNRALGISRVHGYALAKRGEYPVRC